MQNKNLKLKLFQSGMKEKSCEVCMLKTWMNTEIPLELHHINGDPKDNSFANIKILCPNCHALTDNYRGKNKHKKDKIPPTPFVECEVLQQIPYHFNCRQLLMAMDLKVHKFNYDRVQNLINLNNISFKEKEICAFQVKRLNTIVEKYGSVKNLMHKPKITWPLREELKILIQNNSLSSLGKKLGISDNSIRKKAKQYGLNVKELSPWAQKHG